jgi:steroid delta-isomerase-like uncharacterized protein
MTTVDEQRTTVERNKQVVHRIFDEIFNQGKIELADELLTPDAEGHVPYGHSGTGPASLKNIVRGLREGFPDMQMEIQDLIGEGDKVVVAWRSVRQTHLGPYRGIPPTGRAVKISGINLLRFEDGRLAEFSMHLDELGAARQMGAVPPEGISSPRRVAFVLGSLFRFAFLEARHAISTAGRKKNGQGS